MNCQTFLLTNIPVKCVLVKGGFVGFFFWSNLLVLRKCSVFLIVLIFVRKLSLVADEISSQKRRQMHPRLNSTALPVIRDQL